MEALILPSVLGRASAFFNSADYPTTVLIFVCQSVDPLGYNQFMKYDVLVIGGGPAGLMAAGRAGELGARVLLVEKNDRAGIKFLLTGGGRCNLTNNIADPKLLASRFGDKGKFLISAFNKFGAPEIIDFFESRGLKTKIEKNNQVFPVSDRAGDVLKILLNYTRKFGVEIRTKTEVKKIIASNLKIEKIILADGGELMARNYIIATGGKSYALTGSTGAGFEWLKQLGHTIVPTRPALTPILVKEDFIKELEGLSLSQVMISLGRSDKKINSVIGEVIFTASGLSGPAVLNLSRLIGPESVSGLTLELDFFPEIEPVELDQRLQAAISLNGKKLFRNSLESLVPPKLMPVLLKLLTITADKKSAAIIRQERTALVRLLKCFKLNIKAVEGYGKAMVTAGGVSLKEIDPSSMKSKIIANLFIAGEVLDLDGPTGGYNLQVCWSTGFVAGESSVL